MGNKCPAKVTIKGVIGLCMIVKDIYQTVESFWKILGIGPWRIFSSGFPHIPDLEYYGRASRATFKVARTRLGSLEYELIQPLDGDSVYKDWLNQHGEGYHHLKFVADNIADVKKEMARLGFPSIQSGYSSQAPKNQFSIFDTSKALRCIWAIYDNQSDIPIGAIPYPKDPSEKSPARIKIKDAPQVALVVKDLQNTIENYWNILGIGPWELRDWGSLVLPERLYHGRQTWVKEKMGHAFTEDLDLEMFAFVEGESIYQDWIDEHGEGIHHIKLRVDDLDEVTDDLDRQGFPCLLRGRGGLPEEKSGFAYYYIEPLHSVWEPVRESKGGRIGVPTFYPPELAYPIEKTMYR